jgi:hypothetical protein
MTDKPRRREPAPRDIFEAIRVLKNLPVTLVTLSARDVQAQLVLLPTWPSQFGRLSEPALLVLAARQAKCLI